MLFARCALVIYEQAVYAGMQAEGLVDPMTRVAGKFSHQTYFGFRMANLHIELNTTMLPVFMLLRASRVLCTRHARVYR